MKNKYNKILKNQDGLSILSVIGSIVVLGIGLVAALNVTKMSQKGQETSLKKVDAISLTSMVEKKLKSVFLDTKDPSATTQGAALTSGLCTKISVSSLSSQLSNVYIQLPRPSTTELFSPPLWSAKFVGFTPTAPDQSCQLTSKYGKCYKLNANLDAGLGLSKATIAKLDPVFEINIKPFLTNPASDVAFGDISPEPNGSTKYDLKAIGFEYTIKTTYKMGTTTQDPSLGRGFIRGFLWAGDIGICEDQTSGKRISLTANSFGDPNNNTVFNQAGFRSDSISTNINPPLVLVPINSQIRSGVIGGTLGSQFLTSQDQVSNTNPDSGPVYSACNERQFRCVQNSSADREYQSIRSLIRASYVVPNILINTGNSIQIAPKVKIKNISGNDLPATFVQTFDLGGRSYTKSSPDNWYYTTVNAIKIPLLIGEEQTITSNLTDVGDSSSANGICRNICVSSSNFNTNENNHYTSSFSYRVNAGPLPQGVTDTFEQATGPVACTSCYMKNCDQFGLGTFGAMHKQPTEPLDAGVPECVRYESHVSNFYELYPAPQDIAPSSCLSATLKNGDNNGLNYFSSNCGNSLNVLCFAFGKHMLARQILRPTSSTSGAETLVKSDFEAARNVCFELGREDIKKAPFHTLLTQDGNLDNAAMELLGMSNANDNIDPNDTMVVMNFITQGSFFAPVGLNQEVNLRDYADKIGDKPDLLSHKFWVGLRTDNAGYIYAPAPILSASSLSSNVNWGIHYDGSGETVVVKATNNLFLNSTNSTRDAGLLFHTPRFKGVTFVQRLKPFGEPDHQNLRVLCREKSYPHKIFVSTQKTHDFNQAAGICNSSNGVFLPPLTTSGWEIAFQLANPNHSKHPFPKAWSESELNPVWVNVLSNNSMDVGTLFAGNATATATDFIDNQGQFQPAPGEGVSFDKACFDQTKGEIVIRSSCSGNERLLNDSEFAPVQQANNFYLRFMLKMALAKWNGGASALVKIH